MKVDHTLPPKLRRMGAASPGFSDKERQALYDAAELLEKIPEMDRHLGMVSSALKALVMEIASVAEDGNVSEPFVEIDTRRLQNAAMHRLVMTAIQPEEGEGAIGWNFKVQVPEDVEVVNDDD